MQSSCIQRRAGIGDLLWPGAIRKERQGSLHRGSALSHAKLQQDSHEGGLLAGLAPSLHLAGEYEIDLAGASSGVVGLLMRAMPGVSAHKS